MIYLLQEGISLLLTYELFVSGYNGHWLMFMQTEKAFTPERCEHPVYSVLSVHIIASNESVACHTEYNSHTLG